MSKLKSLSRRLFLRYALVLLLVWVGLFSLAAYEFYRSGQDQIDLQLKSGAQQFLAVMRALSDSPEQMRKTAAEIAKYDSSRKEVDESVDTSVYFQVWLGDELIFGDSKNLPVNPVPSSGLTRDVLYDGNDANWLAWSAVDPGTQTKIRLLMEDPISIAVDSSDWGFFILPLLVCIPFLLIPTWLVTRSTMGPLVDIGQEIDSRAETDLKPLLSNSRYKELAPISNAINGLMTRLSSRLVREKEFLSDAAHELKTPLAVIKTQAERITLLLGETDIRSGKKSEIESALNGMQQGVDRATHAIQQLISYSRLDAEGTCAEFMEVELGEFIAERLAPLDGVASSRQIELVLNNLEPVNYLVDGNAFAALIDNLSSNALKHAPSGSRVAVTVSRTSNNVILWFDDQGSGIPVEQRKNVFERFFRLPDSPPGGSGLGLGIAEQAALIHGGKIELDTPESGHGLRVIVTLPV